jgi:endonuclease/exonuclease/phosphatase family metal-dependent hydrolase
MKTYGYFLIAALMLAGCRATSGKDEKASVAAQLTVMSWNVQALFDGTETGNEYGEYRGQSGWTTEKYRARLNTLASAINSSGSPPDILVLVEVEDSTVLEDLAAGALAKNGYNWTFFGGDAGASLGIGVLSALPLTQTRLHSCSGMNGTIPRPVLEVWVDAGGVPAVLFLCHWKSKVGGDNETEPLRQAAARLISRRLAEIEQENPGLPIIVAGDLNENFDEFERRNASHMTALLPDNEAAAELAGVRTDFLVLSAQKPPVATYFPENPALLYSPWVDEVSTGSYHYQDAWETIDHFLLNASLFDGFGWDFAEYRVLNREPFVNSKGLPSAYNPRTGNGLSDHLPLVLVLKRCADG